VSNSGSRNLSQKLETFSKCAENDYLCSLIKLLLEVENCVGIGKSNFMQIHFQFFCSILFCFLGVLGRGGGGRFCLEENFFPFKGFFWVVWEGGGGRV